MVDVDEKSYKLVLAGLDQAGKTSILNILNRNYNLMDSIKPTVGINLSKITVLGIPIVNFDLGGQTKYRQGYLTQSQYFDYTDSLFYVIDAFNAIRYEEALQYFKDIIEIFDTFDKKPKIVLCIHKIDPNIRDEPETQEMIEEIKQLFLKDLIGYDISIYTTSIFDQQTIVKAFSRTLQELISTLKPFKGVCKSLIYLQKIDGAILFDENLLIVGESYISEEIEEVFLETIYNSVYYMKMNPQLSENFTLNFEMILEFKNQKKHFNLVDIEWKGWNFYLLTMGNEKFYTKTLHDKFMILLKDLEKKE
ncbi:MAG: ADP-ribosylation factor-like protein [Candidatus Helarchaeota archaeon]